MNKSTQIRQLETRLRDQTTLAWQRAMARGGVSGDDVDAMITALEQSVATGGNLGDIADQSGAFDVFDRLFSGLATAADADRRLIDASLKNG